ncbi:acyl-CoA synthetase [Mycobacterium pyrenivorans]|nr:acyl-CoA synthetase [Mycolicibacterium pyrenivorans]
MIPRKALRDLGENDHDLLTFDEAGGRLQCEIDRAATLVADLQKTDDATGIQRAKDRLAALKEAACRISEHRIAGANSGGFFGYPAEVGTERAE